MSSLILTEITGKILTITVNRPDKLNALNSEVLEQLREAFITALNNDSVNGIIITGSGDKSFVAGADIPELAKLDEDSALELSTGQEVFGLIAGSPKPVIAAVNGFALGGGCELALACHMRIASSNASFGFPEVKLGLIPGFGGTQRIMQQIGKSLAMEMVLSGERINADRAERIGLINYNCSTREEMMNLALTLMNKIISNSPAALKLAISALQNDESSNTGFDLEAELFARAVTTMDFKEGTSAFMEKRKPEFRGH